MNNKKYTLFLKCVVFFLIAALLSSCSLLNGKTRKIAGDAINNDHSLVIAEEFNEADYTEPYLLAMPDGKLFVMIFSSNYKQEVSYETIKMYIYDPYTGEKGSERILLQDDSSWYKEELYMTMGNTYRYGRPKWYGDEIGIYDYLNSEYVFYDSTLESTGSLVMPAGTRGALTEDRNTYYYASEGSLWSYDIKNNESKQISDNYMGFDDVAEILSLTLYESKKDGSDYLQMNGYFKDKNYGNMLYSIKDQQMLSLSYTDYISNLWLLEDKFVALLSQDYPPNIVFGSYQDIKRDGISGEAREGVMESGSIKALSLSQEMSSSLWSYALDVSDNMIFLAESEKDLNEESNEEHGYEDTIPDTFSFTLYDIDKSSIGESESSAKKTVEAYTLTFDNKHKFFKFGESIAWLGDDVLALVMDDGIKSSLCLWQYKNAKPYSPSYETALLPASSLQVIELPQSIALSEYYQKARNYADKIEEKYGVSIYIGEQAELELWDSSADILTDLQTIKYSLELLESSLAKYPEGFFAQMKDNYTEGVELHLVGTIQGLGATLSNPAAITYTNNPNTMILFDCYQINEGNIHHEIAHAIEGYLYSRNNWNAPIYTLEQWVSFNPDSFSYEDKYNGQWADNLDYTLTAYYDGNGSINEVYFVDGYAKVNNREDMARVFENAMILNSSDSFFKSEHIMNKLAYLSSSIRSLYDSSNWPAVTEWEKGLSQ